MKLFLLLAFAVVGQCALLGGRECAKGPSYWCSHIRRAKECNALQYCMATVWNNQEPEDGTGAASCDCNCCVNFLIAVRDRLANSEKEILSALENQVCPLFGSFATQCKTEVSEYGPVVFQVVASTFEPRTVCRAIQFCSAAETENKATVAAHSSPFSTVQVVAPQHPSSKVAGPKCFACKFIVEKLEQSIATNATEQQIMTALKQVCDLIPGLLKPQCTAFISEYGPQLIKLLIQKLSPQLVCSSVGLCVFSKPQPVELEMLVQPSDGMCQVCEKVMGYIKAHLNDQKTDKNIERFLGTMCSFLPIMYQAPCHLLVSTYTQQIIKLLYQFDDPTKICSSLRLCISGIESQQLAHPLKFQLMDMLQPAQPHRLATKKCSYGPSYWCASVANANECGALDHCVTHYNLKVDG